MLARLKHGEHIQPYETARMRKDGTRVQVSVTVSPLRNSSGSIIGASAIGRDITGRQREMDARDGPDREAAGLVRRGYYPGPKWMNEPDSNKRLAAALGRIPSGLFVIG